MKRISSILALIMAIFFLGAVFVACPNSATGDESDKVDWGGAESGSSNTNTESSGDSTTGGSSGSQNIAVKSITISGSDSVGVGKRIQLSATVTPTNATNQTITWSSNNEDIATVSSTGLVTGIKAGTVIITAKAGSVSKNKTITVKPVQLPVVDSTEQINVTKTGYTLVWNDEFTTSDPDGTPFSENWGYDIGAGKSPCTDGKNPNNWAWGNEELQWYSDNDPDNTYVSDGTLKIVAKKENSNGMNYTSGRLVTRGLHTFKYGYIEMSAKIPNDKGVWPAFWMLDQDIYDGEGWPGSGEIDIMETSVNLWQSNVVYGTLHCQAGYGRNPVFTRGTTLSFSDGKFHKYAVDWDDDHIDWYYDDVKVFTYNPASYEDDPWPFKEEFYIILNLAVGGNLGGDVPADFTSSTMEIDYVRVWQKDEGYIDNSGAIVLTDAPTSTVEKTIPSGAKVIYDSSVSATNGITGGTSWNGGYASSNYNAGNKTIKQITFSSIQGENACGGWDISSFNYGANAKLHMSVYAKHNFTIKPVKPDTDFPQSVSKDGTYEWVDVEIDLGSANSLSQIGFISDVVQTIWVDHVYVTDSSSSGSTGDSGSGGTSGGNATINWGSIAFATDGAGGGTYSNKYKFYCNTTDSVALVNIQKPGWTEKEGLYVTFPTGITNVSLDSGNYTINGAGVIFHLDAFTAKETSFTVTSDGKDYTCYIYYENGN